MNACNVCGKVPDNSEIEEKYQWRGGVSDSQIGSVHLRHHCAKPDGVFHHFIEIRAKRMDQLVDMWNARTSAAVDSKGTLTKEARMAVLAEHYKMNTGADDALCREWAERDEERLVALSMESET